MSISRMLHRWPAFTLVAALTPGCDDAAGPNTLPECTGPVSLTVGPGTAPVFRWTPVCRLFLVLVEDPPGGTGDQWGVDSDSSNAIAPPVTYGRVPEAATKELLPPTALEVGHEYQLTVFRFTGPGHEDGEVIGQTTFTP